MSEHLEAVQVQLTKAETQCDLIRAAIKGLLKSPHDDRFTNILTQAADEIEKIQKEISDVKFKEPERASLLNALYTPAAIASSALKDALKAPIRDIEHGRSLTYTTKREKSVGESQLHELQKAREKVQKDFDYYTEKNVAYKARECEAQLRDIKKKEEEANALILKEEYELKDAENLIRAGAQLAEKQFTKELKDEWINKIRTIIDTPRPLTQ
jgi:hypothetical protein